MSLAPPTPAPAASPAPPIPSATPAAGPLGETHRAELLAARHGGRRLRRAILTAGISGWTTATFAALTALFGIFSLTALVLGAALGAVAWNELRGAALLRRLDERGPVRLGFNQVALFLVILAYAGWSIGTAILGPSVYADQIAANPEFARTLEPIEDLHRAATVVFYVIVAAVSFLVQGATAAYYFTRLRTIRAYLRTTPAWITDLHRAGTPL